MKTFNSVSMLLVAAICSAPGLAAAAKFDGSAAMMCATVLVHECAASAACQTRAAESVNMPTLFRVDVKGMRIHNTETNRESPIKTVEHANGKLLMSGSQSERAWVVIVNENTGRMSGVVSADAEGYVMFGQCALP
jgi:hypothetical protein